MKKMRPYTGSAGAMTGPGWFGYVSADEFWYGEKGGRFLSEGAPVSQEPLTPTGKKRLPIWSELDTDDIVVACPSDMVFPTVEEGDNDWVIWVHKISRDPEHWCHDYHPKSQEKRREGYRKVFEEIKTYIVEKGITFQMPVAPPVSSSQILTLPIIDEKDGTRKQWQVSSTSPVVQKLLEMGKIGRTVDGYYLIDPSPIVMKTV